MPAVTIDLPDELLAKLDRLARWRRTTREALLTDAVADKLVRYDEARRARGRELLADLPPQDGQATRWIREMRGHLKSDNARYVREMRGPCG